MGNFVKDESGTYAIDEEMSTTYVIEEQLTRANVKVDVHSTKDPPGAHSIRLHYAASQFAGLKVSKPDHQGLVTIELYVRGDVESMNSEKVIMNKIHEACESDRECLHIKKMFDDETQGLNAARVMIQELKAEIYHLREQLDEPQPW